MHKTTSSFLFGLLTALLMVASSAAAEWGSLKGRFIVDGTPPKLPPLLINKDPEYCNSHKPANQTVVIGKGNALVNAVVYLRTEFGKKIDVAPEYQAKLKQPAVLDNHFCAFHPHILLVEVGQQLIIKNSDPVGHNTNISLLSFNPIVPANDKSEITVSKSAPFRHPWRAIFTRG